MHELIWQNAIKRYFEMNSTTFVSSSGENIGILSIGKHNHLEGPDFLNACVMIDNELVTGDIEFHKKSSLWLEHNHHTNPNYGNVILHIVFENNLIFDAKFKTLVIDKNLLSKYTKTQVDSKQYDTVSYDEFQQYAICRLLRKTATADNLLSQYTIEDTLKIFIQNYLARFFSMKTRHRYRANDINRMLLEVSNSKLYNSITHLDFTIKNIEKQLISFIDTEKIMHIGKHLKQEILTNALLPVAYCVATSEIKRQLVLWYFSAKTYANYGVLCRNYPLISQDYIWQQQGMLEYYKEYNNRQKVNRDDLLINYLSIMEP